MTMSYRYYTAATLDGFLADEHDSLDWLFTQDIDEAGAMNYADFVAEVGAVVMGSTTYEWILRHEAAQGNPWPYEQPCFVFTSRDLDPATESVHIVQGTPGEHRTRLEEAAGERGVWVVGGGDLAAQFATDGMLDEVMVSIAPVTLGAGRPLFPRPFDLRLIEVAQNRAFVCARYAVVGPRV